MEKQSTRKLFMLVIAVVSLFLLCMSAFMLTSCGDEEEVEHTHDFTYNVQTLDATCGSTGLKVSQCECGQFQVEAIAITGKHSFSDGYCTVCGISETADDTEVLKAIEAANTSATEIATAVQNALNNQLTDADDSAEIAALSEKVVTLTSKIDELAETVDTLSTSEEVAAVKAELETLENALESAKTDLTNKIQTVIDSIHTHTWVAGKTVAPTCRTAGFTVYTCEGCGSVQTADYVDALGGEHQFNSYQDVKDPTCITTGIRVWYCDLCSATYQEVIPVIGHDYELDVDASLGLALDEDGNVIYNQDGDPKIENCRVGAIIVYVCKVPGCGDVKRESINGAPHNMDEGVVTTEATCGNDGVKTYTCTVCTYSYEKAIPATGEHTWDEGVVKTEPTCTEDGVTLYTCTVCGTTKEEAISATGHTESGETVTYYTNVKIGTNPVSTTFEDKEVIAYVGSAEETTYQICAVCKAEFSPSSKAAGIHLFVVDEEETGKYVEAEIIKAAAEGEESTYGYVSNSCTETGYVWFYCIDETCYANGDKNVRAKVAIEPNDHDYEIVSSLGFLLEDEDDDTSLAKDENGEYILVNCAVGGTIYYECANCDANRTYSVNSKAHNWVEGDYITEPTCTEDGEIKISCSDCTVESTKVVPATGHTWDDGVVTTPANCITDGVLTYTCTVCGETKTEVIPANGQHDFSVEKDDTNPYGFELGYYYNTETKEMELCWTTAGCDRSGYLVKYCKICDYFEIDYSVYVPMLGHDYSVETVIEGDCITGMYVITSCSRCGNIYTTTITQPTGHTLVYVSAQEAACTEAGYQAFAYCTVCHLVIAADETMTEENLATYAYSNKYVKDANGENCKYYGETTVEEEVAANKATLEALAVAATGHKFTGTYSLTTEDCTSSGWAISVCSVCGFTTSTSEDGETTVTTLSLKADTEGYEADESLYTVLSVEEGVELTDAEKTALVDAINTQLGLTGEDALTYEELEKLTTGYNFTAIEYKKAVGHSYTDYTSCVAIEEITDVDSYIAYVQKLNEKLTVEALTEKWNAAVWTEGLENKVAAVCLNCGDIIVATGHDVRYYAYTLKLNGEVLDWDIVVAALEEAYDEETKEYDKDAVKAALEDTDWAKVGYGSWVTVDYTSKDSLLTDYVFTIDQLEALGFVTDEGRANCYFKAFCYNNCGEAMGNDHAHVLCEDKDVVGKYPSCQNPTYCVWCDAVMGPYGDHVLAEITEEIAAEYADQLAALLATDWYKADVAATCQAEGIDYTYEICLPCLLAWYEDNASVVWTNAEGGNYTVTSETTAKIDHVYAQLVVGVKYTGTSWICSEGTKYIDVCVNCGAIRVDTAENAVAPDEYATELTEAQEAIIVKALSTLVEKDDSWGLAESDVVISSYTTDADGWYNVVGAQAHKIALQDGYQNTAAKNADGEYVYSFFCITCGYAYQITVLDADTLEAKYYSVYATDAEVEAYNTVDEDGNSTAEYGIAHAVSELTGSEDEGTVITLNGSAAVASSGRTDSNYRFKVSFSDYEIASENGYVVTITVSGATLSVWHTYSGEPLGDATRIDANLSEFTEVSIGANVTFLNVYVNVAEGEAVENVVVTITVSAAAASNEDTTTEDTTTEDDTTADETVNP